MKKLIFQAALAFLLPVLAHADVVSLDVPYSPPPEVVQAVSAAPGWTEIYRVEPSGVKAAIQGMQERGEVPPALAVAVEGRLNFSMQHASAGLDEAQVDIRRDGKSIAYDDDCVVRPLPGDRYEAIYRSTDGVDEVTVDATVVEHFAFGYPNELATTQVRLDLGKPGQCAAVNESRIVLQGTLTYKRGGKTAATEPVLVQTIVQP